MKNAGRRGGERGGKESRGKGRGERGREKRKAVGLQRVDREREEKNERTGNHTASEGESPGLSNSSFPFYGI